MNRLRRRHAEAVCEGRQAGAAPSAPPGHVARDSSLSAFLPSQRVCVCACACVRGTDQVSPSPFMPPHQHTPPSSHTTPPSPQYDARVPLSFALPIPRPFLAALQSSKTRPMKGREGGKGRQPDRQTEAETACLAELEDEPDEGEGRREGETDRQTDRGRDWLPCRARRRAR